MIKTLSEYILNYPEFKQMNKGSLKDYNNYIQKILDNIEDLKTEILNYKNYAYDNILFKNIKITERDMRKLIDIANYYNFVDVNKFIMNVFKDFLKEEAQKNSKNLNPLVINMMYDLCAYIEKEIIQ